MADKPANEHKGKQESSPKFEWWRHKQKDCGYKKTLLLKWMRRRLVDPPDNATSGTNRVTPPLRLSSTGTAQSTAGTISTLMEDHAQSGWLCDLEKGL